MFWNPGNLNEPMTNENEYGDRTFLTKSGRPFLVRQLISDDITLLHAQNVFQNDFITIDDMVFESIITHPEYGQRMIVALLDGQIIGKVRIGLEQCDIDSRYIGKLGFMRDLTVLPQLRSDGVGAALTEFGETVIRNEGRDHAGIRFTPDTTRPLEFFWNAVIARCSWSFPMLSISTRR